MTPNKITRTVIAAVAIASLWLTVAEAHTVKYVEEQGVSHYVGSAEQIPLQYRTKATIQSVGVGGPDRGPADSDQARDANGAPQDPDQADDP